MASSEDNTTNKRVIYEPNLKIEDPNAAPDTHEGPEGTPPSPCFVVARDREGQSVSYYQDDKWDLSAYQARKSVHQIYFANWVDGEPNHNQRIIIDEMKWFIFLEMFATEKHIAVSTLHSRLHGYRNMAQFADERSVTLKKLLKSPILFKGYLESVIGIHYIVHLKQAFSLFVRLGAGKVGFQVMAGLREKELTRLVADYKANLKQTPPIPTRIYSTYISNLMNSLSEFEAVADRFLELVKECIANPLAGRPTLKTQRNHAWKYSIPFDDKDARLTLPELVSRYDLVGYSAGVKNRHGVLLTKLVNFQSWLGNILYVCNQVVHIFSGMRDAEANRLPFDCLETRRVNGRTHYLIFGGTTKLTKDRSKDAWWVTSPQGVKAITIAQRISKVIYEVIGDTPEGEDAKTFDYPLFVASSYLGFSPGRITDVKKPYTNSCLHTHAKYRLQNLSPIIEEPDIKELEAIDPFRSWREEEDIQVGGLWCFTDHQFRRSLAIYASASGLVSLASLRRQLQHINKEMSVYYAKGSAFAKDMTGGNKDHFCFDYQKAHPESQALAYIAHVLFSDEPLAGAHGNWVSRNTVSEGLLTKDAREQTMKRFRKGEMAYKETMLGGCTEINPCEKRAMRSIVGCLDCSKAVIKPSKLDRMIKVQASIVSRLDPETVEGRTEAEDLEALRAFRARLTASEETACQPR